MEENLAGLSFVLSIGILLSMSFAMIYLSAKLIHIVATYKYKKKLRQYDLNNYRIVDAVRGVPRTLQSIKNPNEIVYL